MTDYVRFRLSVWGLPEGWREATDENIFIGEN